MLVCRIGVYAIFMQSVEGQFVYVVQTDDDVQHYASTTLQSCVDWCVKEAARRRA